MDRTIQEDDDVELPTPTGETYGAFNEAFGACLPVWIFVCPRCGRDCYRIAAPPELFSPVVARKHGRVRSQALAEKIAAEICELEARLVDHLRTDINDVLERRIKLRGLK